MKKTCKWGIDAYHIATWKARGWEHSDKEPMTLLIS